MNRWYAVHTQANAEEKAVFNLQRQGFEIYCPRLRKLKRHARKVEAVLRPLFPRYVFVSLDVENQPWRSINGTFGVAYIIGRGESPTPVPEGLVEAIAAREAEDGSIEVGPPPFQPGETLVVEEGPFKDLVGRFEKMTDRERVTVLLDLMGREVRVAVHHTAVART